MNERFKALVSANLILEHDNKILMSKRKNTGYCDGYYSIVGGHVDGNETITQAMIREAHEEAGITINTNDLSVVHVMHHNSNGREFIHFFLRCTQWSGTITNTEPEKCDDLHFFAKQQLPKNIVPCIELALESIFNNVFYSEFGWQTQENIILSTTVKTHDAEIVSLRDQPICK